MVEQWIAGTHTALAIVGEPAGVAGLWLLAGGLVELWPVDLLDGAPAVGGVPPADGAIAPPELLDAAEREGCASVEHAKQRARSDAPTALDVNRLWTDVLATNHPFRAPTGPSGAPTWRRLPRAGATPQEGPTTLDLSGSGPSNRWWAEKLRRPLQPRLGGLCRDALFPLADSHDSNDDLPSLALDRGRYFPLDIRLSFL